MEKEVISHLIENVKKECEENHIPLLRPITSKYLCDYVKNSQPKNILEIGAGFGYSSLLMASVCNAKIITIEKNENSYMIAKNNFAISNRDIEIILGDAIEVLPTLTQKFDFIFLDGPKAQYYRYLPYLIDLMSKNAILFTDDIYFYGYVKGDKEVPRKKRSIVNNLRKFLELVNNDERLSNSEFDIEDGFSVTKRVK